MIALFRPLAIAAILGVAFAFSATASGKAEPDAGAKPQTGTHRKVDAKMDRALKWGAMAQTYSDKCKTLKIDWGKYLSLMEGAGIAVDELARGRYFKTLLRHTQDAMESIEKLQPADVCKLAASRFGPKGSLVRGLLSDGLGVRLENRLFDWMDKMGL